MRQFEQNFTARTADIDELGHVNNAVWVRWVQDLATAHWAAVATPEQVASYVWVVVRHEIDYAEQSERRREPQLALIWVLVAQLQMGDSWRIGIDEKRKSALVQHGFFGVSRNPIFLGMMVMLVGLLLTIPTAATLAVTCWAMC